MKAPIVGQTIKLNIDVEVEDESGHIARYEAGTEFPVLAICTDGPNQTPEQHLEKYGHWNIDIAPGDTDVQSIWDRSGQSDFTVNIASTNIDITPEDIQD